MKRSRFTEEQTIATLREQEDGLATAEVCRKNGISTATFYAWKAKLGGVNVSEAKQLAQLDNENDKPMRLLADATLVNARVALTLATYNQQHSHSVLGYLTPRRSR